MPSGPEEQDNAPASNDIFARLAEDWRRNASPIERGALQAHVQKMYARWNLPNLPTGQNLEVVQGGAVPATSRRLRKPRGKPATSPAK